MALEASEVAVRVRLLGGSTFEKEAEGVAGATEAIGAAGQKANAHLTTAGSKLNAVGSKMMGFGRTLMTMGIPLAAAGYYASKTASSFQQAMVLLSTQAGESAKAIGGMSTAVEQMAPKFGQTPLAMAQALYPIESIGLRGKQALDVLKAAAIGSSVGLDSLENTADAVTTVMASHIKGSGGPVEAMSLMDKAIGVGKMHLADLTDSFKSGIIPISQQFGLSFKQILASAAALTRLGIPPSQVMSRMRLTLTSMVAPTAEGAKALAKMGIGHNQLAADLNSPGGLLTALEDLHAHTANFSKYDANDLIAAIFGRSRGMAQITSLLTALPQMQNIYGQVMGTTPATLMQHFGQTEQTAAFKYKQVRAQLDKGMIDLGNVINQRLLPILVKMVGPVTSLLSGFTHLPRPIQEFALGLAAAVIIGGPLFMFTGALVKGAGIFLTGIEAIIGPLGAAKLETALASTASSFSALLPLMAAAAVYFGLFHTKVGRTVQHKVRNLGYNDAVGVGEPIIEALSGLGLIHGNVNAMRQFAYEHSSAMTSLSPLAQSDLRALMNFTSVQAVKSAVGAGIMRDLAKEPGFDLSKVPLHSDAIKQAIKEGIKEATFNVMLPNGRILAQTVNEQNRKDQNRR